MVIAAQDHYQGVSKEHGENVHRPCAERHSQADFACPLGYRVIDQAVESDAGQSSSQHSGTGGGPPGSLAPWRLSATRWSVESFDTVNEWRIDYFNVLRKFRISRMTSASFDKKTW
jgi:hypothetical protein